MCGVVVVAPCRVEAPELVAVAKQNPDVNFLGLDTRDSNAPRGFRGEVRDPLPEPAGPGRATRAAVLDSLPPQAIPSTLLVDAQGRVAGRFSAPSRPVSSTLRCRTSLPKPGRSLRVSVAETVTGGSLLLAIPLALLAGFVSFASPCVLPLVPGYVGVVTGVTGAELTEPVAPDTAAYSPAWAFIAGFSLVRSSPYGALLGYAGEVLEYQEPIQRVLGVDHRDGHRLHGAHSVASARSALARAHPTWESGPRRSWCSVRRRLDPCIGPTWRRCKRWSSEGSALRGALLSLAYCIGLVFLPLVIALAFRRMAGGGEVAAPAFAVGAAFRRRHVDPHRSAVGDRFLERRVRLDAGLGQ